MMRRATLAAVSIAAVVLSALAFFGSAPPRAPKIAQPVDDQKVSVARPVNESESGGYAFSSMRVEQDSPDHARVDYHVRWSGPDYPGWHRCTWTVFDSHDGVIGRKVSLFHAPAADLHPQYRGVDVRGLPASATVECDKERVGGPNDVYEVTLVDVQMKDSSKGTFAFRSTWLGKGPPDINACVLEVKHDSEELGEWNFTLMANTPVRPSSDMRFTLRPEPEGMHASPESLDLSSSTLVCRPL